MNIDGEPVGRGLAPAVYRGFMINNRLFAAGASPRPTSKPIISPFAEHQFDRFKHTDKPKFEGFAAINLPLTTSESWGRDGGVLAVPDVCERGSDLPPPLSVNLNFGRTQNLFLKGFEGGLGGTFLKVSPGASLASPAKPKFERPKPI